MYDGIATLKAYGEPTFDEAGNEIPSIQETVVYVQPRGIYSAEFYNAAQIGLKPSLTLVLANRADYAGQKILSYEGKDYNVIRVDWNAQRDAISMICEERVGDNVPEPDPGEESSDGS